MQTVTTAGGAPMARTPVFDFEQWIMILCSQTGINKTDIPKEVLELMKEKANKNDVNKTFFAWHAEFNKPKPLVVPDDIKKSFGEVVSLHTSQEYRNAEQNIDQLRRNIQDYNSRITRDLQNMGLHRETIQKLEGNKSTDLWPAIEEALADGWYTLNLEGTRRGLANIDPMDKYVEFDTPRINLQYNNPKAGINMNVDMGHYIVRWLPVRNYIKVIGGAGNLRHGNYTHPHVGSDGTVCWGNGQTAYTEGMFKYQPKIPLQTLRVILQTYNSNSPYTDLSNFKNLRDQNKYAGVPQELVRHDKNAWVFTMYLPSSYAISYSLGEGEYDGDKVVLFNLFKKVHASDGSPAESGTFYVKTRNGNLMPVRQGSGIYCWQHDEREDAIELHSDDDEDHEQEDY